MSRFLDGIERFKFGILAVLMAYIAVFMYLQMSSYTKYFKIEAFHEGSYIEKAEEVMLDPDNIEIPADYSPEEIKNMVSDQNDTREKAYDNYFENMSSAMTPAEVKALEEQMYKDAGGAAEREEIRKAFEERKKNEVNANSSTENNNSANEGGDTDYKGKTMVEYNLSGRQPHQDNRWYIRNPGYTCNGNGTVVVTIKVNQGGNVTTATYDPSRSSGANSCMIEAGIKYAKMSRFKYSSSSAKIQEGTITYQFISK